MDFLHIGVPSSTILTCTVFVKGPQKALERNGLSRVCLVGMASNNHSHQNWMFCVETKVFGIALFEYTFQVPANRMGFTVLSVAQLKILQEVITLSVFVPFAVFYLKQPLKLDYLWAAFCILGAVYFVFREKLGGA